MTYKAFQPTATTQISYTTNDEEGEKNNSPFTESSQKIHLDFARTYLNQRIEFWNEANG